MFISLISIYETYHIQVFQKINAWQLEVKCFCLQADTFDVLYVQIFIQQNIYKLIPK